MPGIRTFRKYSHRSTITSLPQKHRLARRSSIHTFLAVLLLIPLIHIFRHLPQQQLYTTLHAELQTPVTGHFPGNATQFHLLEELPRHRIAPFVEPAQDPPQVDHEVASVAPLATRSTTLSSTRIATVSIDTVLICHYTNPCCISAIAAALRSLIRQTVIPNSLVLLHSCHLPSEKGLLQNSAKEILNGHDRSVPSLTLYNAMAEHYCPADSQPQFDECLLRYLSYEAKLKRYRLLLSDRDVLEPTAVEKMWMYLEFHSKVSSVKSLAFDESSLRTAIEKRDPMLVKPLVPKWNHTITADVSAVPMMYRDQAFPTLPGTNDTLNEKSVWQPLISVLSKGRLLREALYTTIQQREDTNELTNRQPMLSLQHSAMAKRDIPTHLHSDIAFYKWSARSEEEEIYNETFTNTKHLDVGPIAAGEVEKSTVIRAMFLIPWIDMGGSEKAMLDLADRMVSMKWAITFVLTMPNWQEDSLGEMIYANAWLHKALSLTSDVINLVALAPNHLTSKAFRYVLESRKPDIVFNSNTRWAYGHSAFIRAIVPNAIFADYNHMIHTSWFGGGLPRYGANASEYFDVHFTASKDVAESMEKWIGERGIPQRPEKVKPCHIGTDPNLFYTGLERRIARENHRHQLKISMDVTVVLFAGRFVIGKGTDVMLDLVKKSNSDVNLVGKLFFVFVGEGSERPQLEDLKQKYDNMLVLPPAQGLLQMRNYYAISDVLLLPSVNEGIALVLYEAMASELLVITTDVGGQRELVTPDSGVLVPNSRLVSRVTDGIVRSLHAVLADPEKYDEIRSTGSKKVRSRFTTSKFCDCVIDGLRVAERERDTKHEAGTEQTFTKLGNKLVLEARIERGDGLWKRSLVARTLYHALTIGVKTYVCDEQTVDQVRALMRSIRVNYPHVRVLLGNDGPKSLENEDFVKSDDYAEEVQLIRDSGISVGRNTLVNMTTTKYFMLLDDDHMLDDTTNLPKVLTALEKGGFDLVGLRVRNLPGIDELERIGLSIPRYIARIRAFESRQLVLCLWNENEGPSVYGMTDAIKVDVLHNAFMARTDVLRKQGWRDELQVNEHMTFFLDAWRANVKVGYLPSEFVHHRARLYSQCYYSTRFREDRFRQLLDYEDRFYYDLQCGKDFPKRVKEHLGMELDTIDGE